MIPKIIHFCWLSNEPVPKNLQRYMQSWKKELPDYEFVKWDFSRFDKSSSKWVAQAFDNKKYAFAADFIRLYALYNYGGWYLDMDVEVVKSLNIFLSLRTAMCWQAGNDNGLEVAAFGAEKGSDWLKCCLDYYRDRNFVKKDGSFDMLTLPKIVESQLLKSGFKLRTAHDIKEAVEIEHETKAIPVFQSDFFSPKNYDDMHLYATYNTCLIHHFAGSWLPWENILQNRHPQLYRLYYWLWWLPRYEWRKRVLRQPV